MNICKIVRRMADFLWTPGFNSREVDLGFVVDKIATGRVFLLMLRFPLAAFYQWPYLQ
jgi:hypothetical protein